MIYYGLYYSVIAHFDKRYIGPYNIVRYIATQEAAMASRARRRKRKIEKILEEHLLPFYRNLHGLEKGASDARRRAKSYRRFDVGSTAMGVMPDATFRTFFGANKKRAPGERRPGDECAEMEIIRVARETKCHTLIGFVVIAPHQPDDKSGTDLGATLSCKYCRALFRKELQDPFSPLKSDTRMIFINPDDRNKRPELTVEKVLLVCDGYVREKDRIKAGRA